MIRCKNYGGIDVIKKNVVIGIFSQNKTKTETKHLKSAPKSSRTCRNTTLTLSYSKESEWLSIRSHPQCAVNLAISIAPRARAAANNLSIRECRCIGISACLPLPNALCTAMRSCHQRQWRSFLLLLGITATVIPAATDGGICRFRRCLPFSRESFTGWVSVQRVTQQRNRFAIRFVGLRSYLANPTYERRFVVIAYGTDIDGGHKKAGASPGGGCPFFVKPYGVIHTPFPLSCM